jgi:hypothetical protein
MTKFKAAVITTVIVICIITAVVLFFLYPMESFAVLTCLIVVALVGFLWAKIYYSLIKK